jgi:hypothetical protein
MGLRIIEDGGVHARHAAPGQDLGLGDYLSDLVEHPVRTIRRGWGRPRHE